MVASVREQFRMIDPVMAELRHIDGIVSLPAITVDDGIRLYFAGYNGHQRLAGSIRDDLGVDPAAAFEQPEDRDLAGSATPALALAMAAEVALVDFNLAVERCFVLDFLRDHGADFLVVQRRGMAIDSCQFRRRAGCYTPDKQFKQPVLLVSA